jgi:inorganic pyrophosphatase
MSQPDPSTSPIARLPAYDAEEECYNAVVETPRGSRHKYTWEPGLGLFVLSGVLPAGAVFPFDFGFIPGTEGEDGDPLDVLLLLDDTAFAGCLVPARLLGMIEAEQTERDGETVRNDRLIAVSTESYNHRHVRELEQLGESLLLEIEHFFQSYNQIKGKRFEPVGRAGRKRAEQLVREGVRRRSGES